MATRVNGARLWQSIEAINRFGATSEGELFKPMIGSAVWLGMTDLEEALDLEEADGLTIRAGL